MSPQDTLEPVSSDSSASDVHASALAVQDDKAMSQDSASDSDVSSDSGESITQESLLTIIEIHHRWVETQGKEGRRANFRGQDLTHLDFANLNLMECSFRGANLAGVSLAYSDLRVADFSEAILTQANLTGASLVGTNLVRAKLQYAQNSQADFSGANMTGLVADHASFHSATLDHAILREATLEAADFTEASFKEANLRNSSFVDAVFNEANLTGADFRDTNCERAHFKGATLAKTNFKSANLSGVEMDKTDFSLAQDVAPTYQAESFNLEKSKLAEEQAAVKRAQADLVAREKALQDQKNTLEHDRMELAEKLEIIGILAHRSKKPARWFTITMLIWLLVSFTYGALVFSLLSGVNLQKVKIVEFSIATGTMLGLFLLFFISFLKAIQVQGIVKKILATGLGDATSDRGGDVLAMQKMAMNKNAKTFKKVSSVSHALKQPDAMDTDEVDSKNKKSAKKAGFGKKK